MAGPTNQPVGSSGITSDQWGQIVQQHGGLVGTTIVDPTIPDPDVQGLTMPNPHPKYKYTLKDGSVITMSSGADDKGQPIYIVDGTSTALKPGAASTAAPRVVKGPDGTIYTENPDGTLTTQEQQNQPLLSYTDPTTGQTSMVTPAQYAQLVKSDAYATHQGDIAQHYTDQTTIQQQAADLKASAQTEANKIAEMNISESEKMRIYNQWWNATMTEPIARLQAQAGFNQANFSENATAQTAGLQAGQDAVQNAKDLLATQVGPNFGHDYSNALTALAQGKGGAGVSFDPSDFVTPTPNLDNIANQAMQRVLGSLGSKIVPMQVPAYDPNQMMAQANAAAAQGAAASNAQAAAAAAGTYNPTPPAQPPLYKPTAPGQ